MAPKTRSQTKKQEDSKAPAAVGVVDKPKEQAKKDPDSSPCTVCGVAVLVGVCHKCYKVLCGKHQETCQICRSAFCKPPGANPGYMVGAFNKDNCACYMDEGGAIYLVCMKCRPNAGTWIPWTVIP